MRTLVDLAREISSKDPPSPYVYGYQQMDGIPRFRAALTKTIQDNILKEPMDPDNLVALTGLSAILNKMFSIIGSPGDAVLIPAPYYPMFEGDIATRNGLVPIPVHPREVGFEVSVFLVWTIERKEKRDRDLFPPSFSLSIVFFPPVVNDNDDDVVVTELDCVFSPSSLPGRWFNSPRCRVLQQSLQRRERKELQSSGGSAHESQQPNGGDMARVVPQRRTRVCVRKENAFSVR